MNGENRIHNQGVVYFGKGCKFFRGHWEDRRHLIESVVDYKNEIMPDLTFCNYEKNKDDRVGNCNSNECPLKLTIDSFELLYPEEGKEK